MARRARRGGVQRRPDPAAASAWHWSAPLRRDRQVAEGSSRSSNSFDHAREEIRYQRDSVMILGLQVQRPGHHDPSRCRYLRRYPGLQRRLGSARPRWAKPVFKLRPPCPSTGSTVPAKPNATLEGFRGAGTSPARHGRKTHNGLTGGGPGWPISLVTAEGYRYTNSGNLRNITIGFGVRLRGGNCISWLEVMVV